jgi:hypothetical protein
MQTMCPQQLHTLTCAVQGEWTADVSQALAFSAPNSTGLDIYRCCMSPSALMPLIQKHRTISVRASYLPFSSDFPGQYHSALLAILSQPGVEDLYMAAEYYLARQMYPMRSYPEPMQAAQLPTSSNLTTLQLGKGLHNSGMLKDYVPLLKKLPALQLLRLALECSFDDANHAGHYKVRTDISSCPHGLPTPWVTYVVSRLLCSRTQRLVDTCRPSCHTAPTCTPSSCPPCT